MTDWNMYTDDCFGVSYRQLDPLGRATTFAYDAAGRQTSILDARGVEATFQYDAAGRLTRRMSTHDPPVTFAYDPVGNRTEAVDATGRSTFSYDLLNRRTGVVDPAGHGITYTYDAIGQPAAMTAPNGGIFIYAYGPRGEIDHLVNPQGDRTTFSYDSAARRTLTELANGTRTSYTYDAGSRVQQLYNLKADDSVILGLIYEHDAVGNPTSMLESSGDRVTWTYDATDRLTREERSGASAYDTAYAYDPLGNRLLKDASGALTTSTYDLANQLVTSQDANGVTTHTYDLAGNLHIVEQPTGARTTTTWDDQNRQTGVLLPDGCAVTNTFRFDGLRYSKQEPEATTKFLWDVNNYLGEADDQNQIQAVYTNEPQPYGNLISQYRKGPTLWLPSYYHYDALGSTRVLTNDAGVVTDTYLYNAWGNELTVSGSTVNPFRWVGRVGYYWDERTGTFYIRARVYEPVIARWMSQDPLFYPRMCSFAPVESSILEYSVYHYVANHPLRLLDPSGLASLVFNPECIDGTYWILCKRIGPPGFQLLAGTRPCEFCVKCQCVRDDCPGCEVRLNCKMYLKVEISMDPLLIETSPYTVEEVYAHEQRHVVSWRIFAEQMRHELSILEEKVGCTARANCTQAASGAEAYVNWTFSVKKQRERLHLPPSPPLIGTHTPFEPLGAMPFAAIIKDECMGVGPCDDPVHTPEKVPEWARNCDEKR